MQSHTAFYTTPPTFRQGTNPSTEDIFWLMYQPATHRLLYLLVLPETTFKYSLLGAKRGENHWVPHLANMADGVTPQIVNPESASRYDGQCEVESCDAADTHQETTDNCVFFELLP